MGKLQEQITTGKKVNRPSDNPVVAMKGMAYRMQVDKVAQYQDNLGEVNNWLDSSDDALNHVGQALHRANELLVNAPNGTLSEDDRKAILAELKQLREQIQDIANTKVGEKYIFSGTKTDTPLFDKTTGEYPTTPIPGGFTNSVEIEVFDGITMTVNTDVMDTFKEIDKMFDDIETAIEIDGESSELDRFIGITQEKMNDFLTSRSNIGARQNRAEMMGHRLDSQEASAKKQMSENEDIDYEKVITDMVTEEAIHRAALSVGARIIQPSLVDFLR